jgi:hypothetical protein
MATLSVEQLVYIGTLAHTQQLPKHVTLPSDIDKEFKLPKYTHKTKTNDWRTAGPRKGSSTAQQPQEAEPEWASTSVQDLDQPFDFTGRVLDRDSQQQQQPRRYEAAIPVHRSRFDFAEEPELAAAAPFAQPRGDSRFPFASAAESERSRFGFALESESSSQGVKVSVDNLFEQASSSALPPMPSGPVGSKKPSYIHGYMKYGQ